MRPLLDNLFLYEDTCNVYVIRAGKTAVLIDFGSGAVLDHLGEIGVERVSDVLMTHHHRDQCQGLQRAVDEGIRVWVPHTEQELFHSVHTHWQSREIYNNYNMRQDRFSLLESVPIDGTLQDYATYIFGEHVFTVMPTPGHTIGSISLFVKLNDVQIAFTGDLIAAPGKVWQLSATQWTYNGAEGVASSVLSLLNLKEQQPKLILPSHGSPINEPTSAINLLVMRLLELMHLRGQNPNLLALREKPYEAITPHILWNRTSIANTYVLRSESGKALFIDFGYDFETGMPSGHDRASRRPWLYTLPALKQQFGIQSVDVVIPTHFHDDHVAGINLLRTVESTQVWAADLFADILESPTRFDLPCLWYDPVLVDKRLPLETPFQWEEYTFTLYALPGHTRYAVAILFEVDGQRVLVTGDQYQGHDGLEMNYVYANQFQIGDYVRSAALYQRLQPDLILTGHWKPLWTTGDYFNQLNQLGAGLERLHYDLLVETADEKEDSRIASIYPYQATSHDGQPVEFQVDVHNPFSHMAQATLRMIVPALWQVQRTSYPPEAFLHADGDSVGLQLPPHTSYMLGFRVAPPADFTARRARVAVDVTIDGHHFGQQAEALVSSR